MSETATWLGFEFDVHRPDAVNWNAVPGLYVFAHLVSGQWVALYVGETGSFHARLANHERWPEAKQRGATHIHAMRVDTPQVRAEMEEFFIETLQPPMNVLFR